MTPLPVIFALVVAMPGGDIHDTGRRLSNAATCIHIAATLTRTTGQPYGCYAIFGTLI